MGQKNEAIWLYFVQNPDSKLAICRECQKCISYSMTAVQLKMHLRIKHPTLYEEFLEEYNTHKHSIARGSGSRRKRRHSKGVVCVDCGRSPRLRVTKLVWRYFEPEAEGRAVCTLCRRSISYRSTITNLNQHLLLRHEDTHEEMMKEVEAEDVKCRLKGKTNIHDHVESQNKSNEESDSTQNNEDGYEHYEIIEEMVDDYTDIVYLDEGLHEPNDALGEYSEICNKEEEAIESVVPTNEDIETNSTRYNATELTNETYNKEHNPVQNVSEIEEPPTDVERGITAKPNNDDIDNFSVYISSLLKKIPPELASKLQLDIIQVIINAKLEYDAKHKAKNKTETIHAADSVKIEDINNEINLNNNTKVVVDDAKVIVEYVNHFDVETCDLTNIENMNNQDMSDAHTLEESNHNLNVKIPELNVYEDTGSKLKRKAVSIDVSDRVTRQNLVITRSAVRREPVDDTEEQANILHRTLRSKLKRPPCVDVQ